MTTKGDKCFNPHGWFYDSGRILPHWEMLIRIHDYPAAAPQVVEEDSDHVGSIDPAKLFPITTDTAGQSWSQRELDLEAKTQSNVVIVVGELLRAEDVPPLPCKPHPDNLVETKLETRTLVRRLDPDDQQLYALYNKENDLCHIVPLGSPDGFGTSKLDCQMAFYREWVPDPFQMVVCSPDRRVALWNIVLTEFVVRYLKSNTQIVSLYL